MLQMTPAQMATQSPAIIGQFMQRIARDLHVRYDLPLDDALLEFVDGRRILALDFGFVTDRQVAEFVEACLLTTDAILDDTSFQALMRRPLMRPDTKAETMLRRHVWPHPGWRPATRPDDA